MLKTASNSLSQCRIHNLSSGIPSTSINGSKGRRSPFLWVFGSLKNPIGKNPIYSRRIFGSESGDGGSDPPAEVKAAEEVESVTAAAKGGGGEEVESKDSSAIVPTNPRPEDYLTVTEGLDIVKEAVVDKVVIDVSNLADFVGKPVFHADQISDQTPVGVVMGLAWTALGGWMLYIETAQVEQGEGKGALHLTGQLRGVMKESAQIVHTVVRTILLEKELDNLFFANSKLHLHVPAGATPKDGPSAGCTMITSLLSLAIKRPVEKDLAMTGVVTLTGRILPVGEVKEKTIAARRSQVKTIIFPSANKRDFDEFAANVKEGLDGQIFELGFGSNRDPQN